MKTYITIMNELGHSCEMEINVDENGESDVHAEFDPPAVESNFTSEKFGEQLYAMLGMLLITEFAKAGME